METSADLLEKAALYRRLATIKTTGSARADLVLLEMAWRVERQAKSAVESTGAEQPAEATAKAD